MLAGRASGYFLPPFDMDIHGLHLLLTYQCTFECDHCFVWGSPWQSGVMTLQDIQLILHQAQELGTVSEIYFEGGEPFLYSPLLFKAAQLAAQMDFRVGVVSNAYWATTPEDARLWLAPLAGLIQDLSVSSDLYHYNEMVSQQAQNARQAAEALGIPVGFIQVAQPEATDSVASHGQIAADEPARLMYRGRAAEKLAPLVPLTQWEELDRCPYEDLANPGRLHVDPFGYLHLCQGIAIGNLYHQPLAEVIRQYDPLTHPIAAPLLSGGPAALARSYDLPVRGGFADACHLCYQSRLALRPRFPEVLTPDQMYGVVN